MSHVYTHLSSIVTVACYKVLSCQGKIALATALTTLSSTNDFPSCQGKSILPELWSKGTKCNILFMYSFHRQYTWQDFDNGNWDSQCFGFYEGTVKNKYI